MRLQFEAAVFRAGTAELRFDLDLELTGTGLFGPSGSGKTTLVELLCGIRRLVSGRLILDGVVLDDPASHLFVPPEARGLGFVPQDAALFPHLSVRANLRYGARGAAVQLEEVCALLGLGGLLDKGVEGLSGGERQRVALARALLSQPRLLLLDEPLSGLDAGRKSAILPYLSSLRSRFGLPMLLVSHAPHEIAALCDSVVLLNAGRVLQVGSVSEVFRKPADAEVARILGVETVLRGRLLGGEGSTVAIDVSGVRLLGRTEAGAEGRTEAVVCIRAEDVALVRGRQAPVTSARNRLPGTVTAIYADAAGRRVEIDCGFSLVAQLSAQAVEELALAPGVDVCALIKVPGVTVLVD